MSIPSITLTPVGYSTSVSSSVLFEGELTLANAQIQTLLFPSTLDAVPTKIELTFRMPASDSTILHGNIVDGTVTAGSFQIVLTSEPGDSLHKVYCIAYR